MPYLFRKYFPVRTVVFFIGEGLLIFLSLLLVNLLFEDFFFSLPLFWLNVNQAFIVTLVFQLCLYFFDLYDLRDDLSLVETANKITLAFGVGCIILGFVYFTVPQVIISSKVFWSGYLIIFITVLIWRGSYYLILRRKLFVHEIIIIGTGRLASDIAKIVEGRHDSCYHIIGFVGRSEPSYNPNKVKVYETLDDVVSTGETKRIDKIIVALDDRRGTMPTAALLKYRLLGIKIEHGISFYERISGRILVRWLDPSGIIFSDGFELSRTQHWIKRLADTVLALCILILTSPLFLIVVILIKLDSPGSIFYIQERMGQANVPFKLIKFRSMKENAEEGGAVWAEENDLRVTRFGGILRKTRFDEIPQMWNVFKGEMSLVGPRPERPVFASQLAESIQYYWVRSNVKPGVTGWAQVCFPYGASEEDALKKLEYDLYYMKNFSFSLDILIIFKTIKTVLFQKGAR